MKINSLNLTFIIFIILMVVLVIVIMSIIKAKYNEGVVKKGQPHRFKYLDTFFTLAGPNIVYIIVSDLDSKKIYAIPISYFNNVVLDTSIYEEICLKTKDGRKIEFGDIGICYLDSLEVKFNKEDYVYEKLNHKKEIKVTSNKLFNLNSKNNMSILDDATFVIGYAEFDKK